MKNAAADWALSRDPEEETLVEKSARLFTDWFIHLHVLPAREGTPHSPPSPPSEGSQGAGTGPEEHRGAWTLLDAGQGGNHGADKDAAGRGLSCHLVACGHSLGGFLATSVTVQDPRIARCVTFESPGVSRFQLQVIGIVIVIPFDALLFTSPVLCQASQR